MYQHLLQILEGAEDSLVFVLFLCPLLIQLTVLSAEIECLFVDKSSSTVPFKKSVL